jgi:hypothetical protein
LDFLHAVTANAKGEVNTGVAEETGDVKNFGIRVGAAEAAGIEESEFGVGEDGLAIGGVDLSESGGFCESPRVKGDGVGGTVIGGEFLTHAGADVYKKIDALVSGLHDGTKEGDQATGREKTIGDGGFGI